MQVRSTHARGVWVGRARAYVQSCRRGAGLRACASQLLWSGIVDGAWPAKCTPARHKARAWQSGANARNEFMYSRNAGAPLQTANDVQGTAWAARFSHSSLRKKAATSMPPCSLHLKMLHTQALFLPSRLDSAVARSPHRRFPELPPFLKNKTITPSFAR